MPLTRLLAATSVLVLPALTLSACAQEPAPVPHESDKTSIIVSVDSDRFEQQALGEAVANAFVRRGKQAYVEVASENKTRLERLEEGRVEVVLGCTGELLNEMNPKQAEDMSKDYVKEKESATVNPNDDEWRDKVYIAMVGSLADTLGATDPSNASGCPEYGGPDLPQNIVPVFRESALNREDKLTLNYVTGGLNKKELDKLYSGPKDPAAVTVRANALLDELGL